MKAVVLVLVAACSSPHASSPSNARHVAWRAGKGVDGCTLGMQLDRCDAVYGAHVSDPDDVALVAYPKAGFEVFEDGGVARVHVLYRGKLGAPFAGTDEHGLGAGATTADVERAYGKGAADTYGDEPVLAYPAHGLRFVFHDGVLARVMIEAPAQLEWQLRTTGMYSHRFPKGWLVMPLGAPPGGSLVDHELIISKAVTSFPAEAPLGEWVRVVVVDGPPERPTACAERSSTTIMGAPFEVCRTAAPPFETSVFGRAGDHGYTFHYNGAARSNPMIEQILSTFTVTPPP